MSYTDPDSFIHECPICYETVDYDEYDFYPCPCNFQICLFCYNRILNGDQNKCPACRNPFEEKLVRKVLSSKKKKEFYDSLNKPEAPASAPAVFEDRSFLATQRIPQKNLIYVQGLLSKHNNAELLKTKLFNPFGKILKFITTTKKNADLQNTLSIYVTYSNEHEASNAVSCLNGTIYENFVLKVAPGTTKYCNSYLSNTPCTNPNCLYLHNDKGQSSVSGSAAQRANSSYATTESNLNKAIKAKTLESSTIQDLKGFKLPSSASWAKPSSQKQEASSKNPVKMLGDFPGLPPVPANIDDSPIKSIAKPLSGKQATDKSKRFNHKQTVSYDSIGFDLKFNNKGEQFESAGEFAEESKRASKETKYMIFNTPPNEIESPSNEIEADDQATYLYNDSNALGLRNTNSNQLDPFGSSKIDLDMNCESLENREATSHLECASADKDIFTNVDIEDVFTGGIGIEDSGRSSPRSVDIDFGKANEVSEHDSYLNKNMVYIIKLDEDVPDKYSIGFNLEGLTNSSESLIKDLYWTATDTLFQSLIEAIAHVHAQRPNFELKNESNIANAAFDPFVNPNQVMASDYQRNTQSGRKELQKMARKPDVNFMNANTDGISTPSGTIGRLNSMQNQFTTHTIDFSNVSSGSHKPPSSNNVRNEPQYYPTATSTPVVETLKRPIIEPQGIRIEMQDLFAAFSNSGPSGNIISDHLRDGEKNSKVHPRASAHDIKSPVDSQHYSSHSNNTPVVSPPHQKHLSTPTLQHNLSQTPSPSYTPNSFSKDTFKQNPQLDSVSINNTHTGSRKVDNTLLQGRYNNLMQSLPSSATHDVNGHRNQPMNQAPGFITNQPLAYNPRGYNGPNMIDGARNFHPNNFAVMQGPNFPPVNANLPARPPFPVPGMHPGNFPIPGVNMNMDLPPQIKPHHINPPVHMQNPYGTQMPNGPWRMQNPLEYGPIQNNFRPMVPQINRMRNGPIPDFRLAGMPPPNMQMMPGHPYYGPENRHPINPPLPQNPALRFGPHIPHENQFPHRFKPDSETSPSPMHAINIPDPSLYHQPPVFVDQAQNFSASEEGVFKDFSPQSQPSVSNDESNSKLTASQGDVTDAKGVNYANENVPLIDSQEQLKLEESKSSARENSESIDEKSTLVLDEPAASELSIKANETVAANGTTEKNDSPIKETTYERVETTEKKPLLPVIDTQSEVSETTLLPSKGMVEKSTKLTDSPTKISGKQRIVTKPSSDSLSDSVKPPSAKPNEIAQSASRRTVAQMPDVVFPSEAVAKKVDVTSGNKPKLTKKQLKKLERAKQLEQEAAKKKSEVQDDNPPKNTIGQSSPIPKPNLVDQPSEPQKVGLTWTPITPADSKIDNLVLQFGECIQGLRNKLVSKPSLFTKSHLKKVNGKLEVKPTSAKYQVTSLDQIMAEFKLNGFTTTTDPFNVLPTLNLVRESSNQMHQHMLNFQQGVKKQVVAISE